MSAAAWVTSAAMSADPAVPRAAGAAAGCAGIGCANSKVWFASFKSYTAPDILQAQEVVWCNIADTQTAQIGQQCSLSE